MDLSRIDDRRRRRRYAPSLTSPSTRTETLSKRSRPLSGPSELISQTAPRGVAFRRLPARLRRAGVGHAFLGEARLGGAVQLLRGGLVLAALFGEAVQGGAVQAFAGRLNGATVIRHGGGDDPKRRDDDGQRSHVSVSLGCFIDVRRSGATAGNTTSARSRSGSLCRRSPAGILPARPTFRPPAGRTGARIPGPGHCRERL